MSNAKLAAQTKRMLGLLEQYVFHRKKVFAPKDNPFSQIDYQYVTIGEHTP